MERRYSKLVFSGYTADNDLLDGFISGLTDANILQVLMDGPIVNWKCYGHITIDIEQAEFLGFINIKYGKLWSPCFHGAFKTGVEAAGWEMKKIAQWTFSIVSWFSYQLIRLLKSAGTTQGFLNSGGGGGGGGGGHGVRNQEFYWMGNFSRYGGWTDFQLMWGTSSSPPSLPHTNTHTHI